LDRDRKVREKWEQAVRKASDDRYAIESVMELGSGKAFMKKSSNIRLVVVGDPVDIGSKYTIVSLIKFFQTFAPNAEILRVTDMHKIMHSVLQQVGVHYVASYDDAPQTIADILSEK
jgi:hypothetical protein